MSRSHIAATGCVLAITALTLTTLPAVAARWAADAVPAPARPPAVTPSPAVTAPARPPAAAPSPAVTAPRPGGTVPTPAAVIPTVLTPVAPPQRAESTPPAINLPPGVIEALQRDLGLTRRQAEARLRNEIRLAPVEARLREELGGRFAGSWFTGTTARTLVVATTSAADIPRIVSAGARAEVVRASLATLKAVKRKLDDALPAHPAGGSVRYVDVRSNKVVVLSRYAPVTQSVVKSIGVDTNLVVVVASEEDPRPRTVGGGALEAAVVVATEEEPPPLQGRSPRVPERPLRVPGRSPRVESRVPERPRYDLKGGDAYYIGTGRCSVGFPVTRGKRRGFVTAGHCGKKGDVTTGFNRVAQGVFQGSTFPVSDFAWIAVNDDWVPTAEVSTGGAETTVPVTGATVAVEGASVCRSGSTTGWHCGLILQHDVSAVYPTGKLFELTRTNVCSERGDSGGAFVSIDQAQGVTSGGWGDCETDDTDTVTYFQPIREILKAYRLTLMTAAPAPPPASAPSPVPTPRPVPAVPLR
ncbi:S1 family peptidase [Streptosporangium sp. NPDC002524]|uniref:S1 family peptidase n=1 Tax=Streptosporangium sp. NPDC002524 TaxID=3154537 RepID=UPI00332412E7